MNYFKVLGIIVLSLLGILLFATSTANVETIPPPPFSPPAVVNPIKQEFVAAYKAYFEKESTRHLPGAALAIVIDSSVFFVGGYGYKNSRTKERVDENTVFRIGSLSKGFAGVLAGILEQENTISLNDKVVEYLPDFKLKTPEQTNQLAINHVLSHTSGLQYHAYTNLVERVYPLDEIYARFPRLKLLGKPGEVYAYQNAAYCLAETAMEEASCSSYKDLIAEKIFKPLDMKGASVSKASMINNENFAFPHVRGRSSWRKKKISDKYYNAIAAGGVNANILDMGKWMKLLMGYHPEIIGEESLNKVFTPHVNIRNKKFYYQRWPGIKDSYYALGWRILETKEGNLLYHGGQVNNFRSEIAIHQEDKVAICVLSNAQGSFTAQSISKFLSMYDKYKDKIKAWEKAHP